MKLPVLYETENSAEEKKAFEKLLEEFENNPSAFEMVAFLTLSDIDLARKMDHDFVIANGEDETLKVYRRKDL